MTQFIYIIIFAIGFVGGFVSGLLFSHKSTMGTLRINHSDPSKDLVTLELENDLDYIEKHKEMVLGIKVE